MKQTQSFNAEIKQLLDIVIHSLYSNKEIFLRELISNASDAIDKLKFNSLTQPELAKFATDPQIRLEADPTAKTLSITDTGIGMTSEEVIQFIGTIAKSGTKAFTQLQDVKNRPELIGQFGVGFYSAFIVADRVTLHTQKAGTNMGVVWESTGDGTYTIDEVPRALGHGTTITLHLKPQADKEDDSYQDFTDTWTLRSLVKKYSDFIASPIVMKVEHAVKSEDGKSESKEFKDETLNSMKALWLKSPSEVKDEEYNEFYQHITHDWNPPSKHVHYKAEGMREFSVLFYLPSKKPWNYQTKDYEYGLNLYIKRVFIMENCKDLLPAWLRFVKGLVDSSDLSLNVSREILQQDREVAAIKKNVVAKVLSTLKDWMQKDRKAYEAFYKEFGTTLKEGVPMDGQYKDKIAELLLFSTSQVEGLSSLDEYIARMKPEQKDIYYIIGERLEAIKNSAYLEKLHEKGFEVLLMTDVVDEWLMRDLSSYKDKKFQSITKEGLDLDSAEEKAAKEQEKKSLTERFKPLMEQMKSWLGDDVCDVVISDRLTKTPVCLVNSQYAMSAHMEKILAQMGDGATQKSKRILEINAKHPIFAAMMGAADDQKKNWTEILYNQALLTEGSPLPDPVKFSNLIADLMVKGSAN